MMQPDTENCGSCQVVQGKITLTNVPRIHDGDHWIVEHVHPTSVKGWLVVVAKCHRTAIHELSSEEAAELGILLPAVCRALHEVLDTRKEYVFQMAEKDGFDHVHFHVIARLADWPSHLKGPRVFEALGEDVSNPLTTEQLIPTTTEIATILKQELTHESSR